MTCTCTHPFGDHQVHDVPNGDQWAGTCDLCDCGCFIDAATPPLFGDES